MCMLLMMKEERNKKEGGSDDGKTLQNFPNEYSIDPLIFDSN